MDNHADAENRRSPTVRIRRWLSLLVLGYFIALFVGTHIPRVPQGLTPGLSDKHLHFLAYGGLALLIAARSSFSRRMTWRHHALLWLIIAGYGALDELLQIPVGRDAEVADWLMDIAGAATGLLACAFFTRWVSSRSFAKP
jgi:VanZ family protein